MGADCFYDINTERIEVSRFQKPSRIVALRNNAAIYICAPLTLAKGVRNIYPRGRYLFGYNPRFRVAAGSPYGNRYRFACSEERVFCLKIFPQSLLCVF